MNLQDLAKITLRIPDLDSGASAVEAKTCAEPDGGETELLHARRTRSVAAADSLPESAQPRVDFQSPPISPEIDRDKSIDVIDIPMGIVNADELIDQQRKDEDLGIVRAWLENPRMVPDKNVRHAYGPDIQQLWARKESLEITRGILYRRYVRPNGSLLYLQILVPRSLRTAVLDAVHAGAINGHPGIERTRERLQEIAYWKGWTDDVYAYVQRCSVCAAHRPDPRCKQGQVQQVLAYDVMQKVHVDFVGPFPTSTRGYKYLLTAICGFTKYLVSVPIREKVSATIAEVLMKHLYLVYGPPETLVHDQDGEFWSDVMTKLAALLDIQPSKITSHRPNSNRVVEQVHATLHSMFGKLVNENQRNWCELVPYVIAQWAHLRGLGAVA